MACELGVSNDQFWSMIPSEFIILVDAKINALEKQEERLVEKLAFIAATIANFSIKTKRHFKAEDFMKSKSMDDGDMLKTVKKLNALLGGSVTYK